jgi:hypothetical protein
MINELYEYVGKDMEGKGNEWPILAVAWRKPRKTSVRKAIVLTEVRIKHLRSTSLEETPSEK